MYGINENEKMIKMANNNCKANAEISATNSCENTSDKGIKNDIFQCGICCKTFKTKKYLKCHLKIHTGNKAFKCKMCDRSFLRSAQLRMHENIHNVDKQKFYCEICGQGYSSKSYLKAHLRIHSGERPYKCEI